MPKVQEPMVASSGGYSTETLSAAEIKRLLKRAKLQAGLSKTEEQVIVGMSSQLGNKAKKQVAEELGKSLWDIYNIRRSGLRKIAKILHLWDEEALFPMLGLKRGRRLPPRHTKYLVKTEETSMTPNDESNPEIESSDAEENEDDGGEAAVDEFKEFGDPDDDDKSVDEDDEDEDEDEDEDSK